MNARVTFVAKTMKMLALVFVVLTIHLFVLHLYVNNNLIFTLMITFGTTSYHFVMRLLTGFLINLLLKNCVNYHARWFQVRPAEQNFYKTIKVKKWKRKVATYDPKSFDPAIHSWDKIAQAMCQAELVHEVIIVLSFVPILASIPLGELWAFTVTSVLAACVDAVFVILQRFNRPRVMRLITNLKSVEKECSRSK